jgi:hypothetical protein
MLERAASGAPNWSSWFLSRPTRRKIDRDSGIFFFFSFRRPVKLGRLLLPGARPE